MDALNSSIVAHNCAPGGLGRTIELFSNTYGICLLKPTIIYAYDVNIVFETDRQRVLQITKKAKDDFLINQRRNRAVKVLRHLLSEESAFFGDAQEVWYDGQSLLFSRKDFFDGRTENLYQQFNLAGTVTEEQNIDRVMFELVASARRSFDVDHASVQGNTANCDLTMNDRSLTQFLELALNQYAIMNPDRYKCFPNGKTFFCNPLEEGFAARDVPEVDDGKKLYVGSRKSVKMIEGPRGRGYNNPSVVVDPMKAAFHEAITVIEKANRITGEKFEQPVSEISLRRLRSGLKGLGCVAMYLTAGKVFEIEEVSERTANSYAFEYNGSGIFVKEYFVQRYNITLRYPDAPLLLVKEGNKISAVPMELAVIQPFQRVTIPQQSSEQSAKTTKEAAIPPEMRAPQTQVVATGLNLFNPANKYISNAGIQVWEKPISFTARILPSANVNYGRNETVHANYGKWRPGRSYIMPSSCNIWAVYRLSATRSEDQKIMEAFANMYHLEMQKKGMQWPAPSDRKCVKEENLEVTLAEAHKHNCKFVLLISPDSITNVHKRIKLLELEYGMVIQDARANNVAKVVTQNKHLTVENMVAKTNLKMGGLNYTLNMLPFGPDGAKWISPDRLIVGIGMSHPPPGRFGGSTPTTVGFTANFDANPNQFVGDFLYQESRRVEIASVIHEILFKLINMYKASHSGHGPKELIIYRSGADHGHFPEILQNEIPQARETLESLEVDAKLVYIVVNKGQSMRFFHKTIPRGKPTDQNIPAGTVVDTVMSHPSHKEFYLNSHITLQGSASTPLYSVILDELNMDMNQLEGLTYALAHNHQIVALTTSLPAPVYIALEYAKRGSYLFTEYMNTLDSGAQEMISCNYTELNKVLGYSGTTFSSRRVNA